jgi:hypothetical protein
MFPNDVVLFLEAKEKGHKHYEMGKLNKKTITYALQTALIINKDIRTYLTKEK